MSLLCIFIEITGESHSNLKSARQYSISTEKEHIEDYQIQTQQLTFSPKPFFCTLSYLQGSESICNLQNLIYLFTHMKSMSFC